VGRHWKLAGNTHRLKTELSLEHFKPVEFLHTDTKRCSAIAGTTVNACCKDEFDF
jgi:hypothetical protein